MSVKLSQGADSREEPMISAEFSAPADEHTVDLEITAQDLIGLWSAASTAETQTAVSTAPAAQTLASSDSSEEAAPATVKLTDRGQRTRIAANLVIAFALVMLGIATYRVVEPIAPEPPHHTDNTLVQARAPEPEVAQEQRPPVRIRNPFDRSEIFEFPPGTPKRKAREAVANLLMERARDRQTRRGGKPPSAA